MNLEQATQTTWRNLTALPLVILSIASSNAADDPKKGSDAAKPSRPNILLIVADDMGYSDIGPFGSEISTPTLDSLAKEGLRATNFHVLPTCSPSRSVLLSGMDNHRAGLGTMGEMKTPEMDGVPGYEGYLNHQVAALPELMRADGYHTYMIGKWHLGHDEKTVPHARGFEESFVLVPGGGSHWADQKGVTPTQPMLYQRNGQVVETLPDDFYSTKYYTDRVLEWLRKNEGDGKPFFAYLAYTAPHDPLHAPKEYIDKYKGTYDGGWDELREKRFQALKALGIISKDSKPFPRLPSVKAWDEMDPQARKETARDMEVYAAMIDCLDEQIKRILDQLKQAGQYDNTMILFISDNGANGSLPANYPGQTDEYMNSFDNRMENRGLQGSFIETGPGWAQASMSPSRLYKGVPAEGGIRAPLIVKLPGKMPNAGKMSHSFFHIRDLMPTMLEAASVDHHEQFGDRKVLPMQGRSVLDLFNGKSKSAYEGADQVGYELFGNKAFFNGPWKILWLPKPLGKGEWELFNLAEDPAELNDLSETHPEKLKQLVAQWQIYKKENGVLEAPSK
ncbi:arylsulfatase [Haloferula sp.]|uniref:arylsulfatase n=1 Tax=Haloferula sp. TaxID=2497595 RepID=UPI00329B2125